MSNPASTDISLCPHCHCMTKIVGLKWCGKCRKDKSAYTDLDAQLDEILTRLENAVARDVTMRTMHHSATRSPKSVHRDAKQALTKLIADEKREARQETIGKIFGDIRSADLKALIRKAEMMQDLISPLKGLDRMGKIGRQEEVKKWAAYDELRKEGDK